VVTVGLVLGKGFFRVLSGDIVTGQKLCFTSGFSVSFFFIAYRFMFGFFGYVWVFVWVFVWVS